MYNVIQFYRLKKNVFFHGNRNTLVPHLSSADTNVAADTNMAADTNVATDTHVTADTHVAADTRFVIFKIF